MDLPESHKHFSFKDSAQGMTIQIISIDKLWAESLCVALTLFGEPAVEIFETFDNMTEPALKNAPSDVILMVDAGLPGLDYWSLVAWLNKHFAGKSIIFTNAHSYNIQHAQLLRTGCHGVISKTQGLLECWKALTALRQGLKYYVSDRSSPFDALNEKERKLATDLLQHDTSQLIALYGITQQGINKKKHSLYQKLNIRPVEPDTALKLIAQLQEN